MARSIFISHTNRDITDNLERLIRDSFPGEVEVFNSSRSASGLAPGEPIDSTLQEKISRADIIIWLATPISVKKSFWMAWELGVANALNKSVFPCRALGLSTDNLPLLQSARYVPDLGSYDDLTHFLHSIYKDLKLNGNNIAEVISAFKTAHEISPFESTKKDVIGVTFAGTRIIIENHSAEIITNLNMLPNTDKKRIVEKFQSISGLEPNERKVINVGEVFLNELSEIQEISIRCRWLSSETGRHYQDIAIQNKA